MHERNITLGLLSFCALLLSGAYAITFLERLPSDGYLFVAIPLACLFFAVRPMRPVGYLLLGFVLMWLTSRDVLTQRLEPELVGENLTSSFRISDFVAGNDQSVSLVVSPLNSENLPGKIRLSWFAPDQRPELGECWELRVRLKRPRGYSNSSGFDYEGWLFREAIGATGYVREGRHLDQCPPVPAITALRRQFVERLSRALPDDDATAVLMAITVGARHKISDAQWRRYAISGTSHLMAISGLHIGLAAGGAFLLSWCLLALCNRCGNLHDQAAIIAVLVAASYAALSGFAVPARRALMMLVLVLLATWSRRQLPPMHVLAICSVIMMVVDPLAILASGFQLSFAAVAILFWIASLYKVAGGRAE